MKLNSLRAKCKRCPIGIMFCGQRPDTCNVKVRGGPPYDRKKDRRNYPRELDVRISKNMGSK